GDVDQGPFLTMGGNGEAHHQGDAKSKVGEIARIAFQRRPPGFSMRKDYQASRVSPVLHLPLRSACRKEFRAACRRSGNGCSADATMTARGTRAPVHAFLADSVRSPSPYSKQPRASLRRHAAHVRGGDTVARRDDG